MAFYYPPPAHGHQVEGLAAKATLQVYLNQMETPEPRADILGWVEERAGEPEKEVDSLAGVDFLTAAGRFLEQTGVRSVYDIWFGHNVVYRVSKEREWEDNHREALSRATDSSRASKDHLKEIGIWSHGMSGDFYLEFRLRFRRVHDLGAPPLILEVAGNPRELADPTGKNQFELDDRLTRLESDKSRVEKENVHIKPLFESKLRELQGTLKQTFSVKVISQDLKIDVGSIW
ncbi:MAG: hypothetical protein OK474_04605 [Thaumarchaeota archaeon]|nr:hypothetical protein [Nitrososphaerota archaeon]